MNRQITQAALVAAKKVERRKYGYIRNGELTICGRRVILYKMILDCKTRRVPPIAALERRATALQVPLARFAEITFRDIRKVM